jgi:uncharacterized protein YaiL (DUF2058 family)
MANPFQDQFLKAGLTNKKKVKQAQRNQHITDKKKRKGEIDQLDESQKRAIKQAKDKANKDRQLNKTKNEQASNKAIKAQIKQLIQSNKVITEETPIKFNFEDNKKIKHINVDPLTQKRLVSGMFCIAKLGDQYLIIPREVSDKIKQRNDSYIILSNTQSSTTEQDDEYADYQIPDDLMW